MEEPGKAGLLASGGSKWKFWEKGKQKTEGRVLPQTQGLVNNNGWIAWFPEHKLFSRHGAVKGRHGFPLPLCCVLCMHGFNHDELVITDSEAEDQRGQATSQSPQRTEGLDGHFWLQLQLLPVLFLYSIIEADFCVASTCVAFGAVLGKISPVQLLIMTFFQVTLYAVNEFILTNIIEVSEPQRQRGDM